MGLLPYHSSLLPIELGIRSESMCFERGLLSEDMYPGPRQSGNILNMKTKNSY